MKITFGSFLAVLISAALAACGGERPQVIDNPAYEATATGITSVERIEHTGNGTLVTVRTSFLPGWWVEFSSETRLEIPETGETLGIVSMDNGEIGAHIYMPASGDSVFVLRFPPLDEGVRKVNFIDGDETRIYGISLCKEQKPRREAKVPAKVKRWINRELRASKRKEVWDLSPEKFFVQDTARVVGYMKGYDSRLGFKTAIVYTGNEILGDDFPVVVDIHPDGRFEADIPLSYPKMQALAFSFRNMWLDVYVEPGMTLGVVLDLQDFLDADRYRNKQGEFTRTEYLGPAGRLNRELAAYRDVHPEWNVFQKQFREMTPEQYKAAAIDKWDGDIAELEGYAAENDILPESEKLLRANIDEVNAEYLYNYVMYRKYESTDAAKAPVPGDYYDFMRRLDMDDPAMLVPRAANVLINRFEFAAPFSGAVRPVTLPAEASEEVLNEALIKENIGALGRKDSVLANVFGLKRSLISQIANTRTVSYIFDNFPEDMSGRYLDELKKYVTDDFLTAQVESCYDEVFADSEPEELPGTAAGRMFGELIEPFRGKILLVDFWAVWCGPCLSGIEHSVELRREYAGSPDIEFLFITAEGDSPLADYNRIVEQNAMTHSFRVGDDDYARMRELFRFNAIPRYVLVDRAGRIIDRSAPPMYLKESIERMIERYP